MMRIRALAIGVGAAILATVAHVNVAYTGGYGTPHSYLTIAITAGVTVASVVFGGWVLGSGRRALSICFVCSIIAAEMFNLASTAERLIKGREAEQTPLRDAKKARAKAEGRVAEAEVAANSAPTTSERLKKAEKAKENADSAVVNNSAALHCREHCRLLLQGQVTAAAEEVGKAQTALSLLKEKAETELTAARAALDLIKEPESPTPLADKTGYPAWVIDLVIAALGSIAANGLACCLLIFGAHRPTRRVEVFAPMPASPRRKEANPLKPQRQLTLKDQAARFALECMSPQGEVDLQAIRQTWSTWSAKYGLQSSAAEIGQALADLFEDAGIHIDERNDGRLVAVGISLKEPVRALVSHETV